MLFAPRAAAQAYIWDGGGANGTWSTNLNWGASAGVPSTTAGSTQTLDFGGTVQLASTMGTNYSASSLTFDSTAGAFTIALGTKTLTLDGATPTIAQQSSALETISAGTVAFSSAGIIDLSGGDLTITSKLTGSSLVTQQGSGTLTLSGNNSGLTGGFEVNSGGTVSVSTSNNVLGTGTATIDSGATLLVTDGRNLAGALNLTGTGVGGVGAVEKTGANTTTLSGAITLGGDTTFDVGTGGTLKLSGGVTGSGDNLTFTGAGAVTLASAFATSSLTLNGSGIVTDSASNQIATSTNLAINSGTFSLGTKTEQVASLSGLSGGTLAFGGAAGSLTESGTTNSTFAGAITGTGTLANTGTGQLSLTGASAGFTGKITLSDGSIIADATNATGTATVTVSNLGNFEVEGGSTLGSKFSLSTNGGPGNNGAIENISGSNSLTGAVTLTGNSRIQSDAGTLTVSGGIATGTNTLNVGGSGNTTITTSAITGSGALTKDGIGTLAIGVANTTFSGTVTVSGGTLQMTVANAFKATTVITVNTSAIMDLNGTSQVIGTLTDSGTLAFGSGGAVTLSTGTSLLSGVLTGTGTLTIGSGASLTLGANFSDSGLNIVLAGGTLNLNGTSDTFGSLSITANSIVDFANPSTSVLSVNGVTLSGGTQLSVNNWANLVDYFYSSTSPGTMGSAPINQIVFNGFSGNVTRWNAYNSGPGPGIEITPIPESTLYGAVLMALSLACIVAARRKEIPLTGPIMSTKRGRAVGPSRNPG